MNSEPHSSPWKDSPLFGRVSLRFLHASQVEQVVKNLPVNAGDIRDVGLIPGSGRSPWKRAWLPTPISCLGNPMDRGAWWVTVHGVAELDTTLAHKQCPLFQPLECLSSFSFSDIFPVSQAQAVLWTSCHVVFGLF